LVLEELLFRVNSEVTLELARLVGPAGHVIAVDIQPKMLNVLKRRAAKSGMLDRVDLVSSCSGFRIIHGVERAETRTRV
jgi:ubiquinone/menaquinone biosynthesis C-methylase UbiE